MMRPLLSTARTLAGSARTSSSYRGERGRRKRWVAVTATSALRHRRYGSRSRHCDADRARSHALLPSPSFRRTAPPAPSCRRLSSSSSSSSASRTFATLTEASYDDGSNKETIEGEPLFDNDDDDDDSHNALLEEVRAATEKHEELLLRIAAAGSEVDDADASSSSAATAATTTTESGEDDETTSSSPGAVGAPLEEELLQSHERLGQLHWSLGNLHESQCHHEDALRILIQRHGGTEQEQADSNTSKLMPDHLSIARHLHVLGSIHARSGDSPEAYRWYDASLSMKRRLLGGKEGCYHPELGKTLNGLALLKLSSSQSTIVDGEEEEEEDADERGAMRLLEEAERHYVRCNVDENGVRLQHMTSGPAIRIDNQNDDDDEPGGVGWDENPLTSSHPDLIHLYTNMGHLYRQHRQYDRAIEKHREALRIGLEWLTPADDGRSHRTVELRLDVADCLLSMGDVDHAAVEYETSLVDHLHLRQRRQQQQQQQQEREEQTDEEEEKEDDDRPVENWYEPSAYDVDETTAVRGTAVEAVIRHNLGLIHARKGRNDMALTQYEVAHKIKRRIGGDSNLEVAHTLNCMGALLGVMGENNRALSCFREALFVYRMHAGELGDDDPNVVDALRNVALIEASVLKDGEGGGGGGGGANGVGGAGAKRQ